MQLSCRFPCKRASKRISRIKVSLEQFTL